jgi:hypothetical protein
MVSAETVDGGKLKEAATKKDDEIILSMSILSILSM